MIEQIPFNIGIEKMSDELTKYHISNGDATPWPFTPVFHRFTGVDRGDYHDHPFSLDICIIEGWYVEEIYDPGIRLTAKKYRSAGDRFTIPATHIHKIVEMSEGGCWTMMIPGPKECETVFYHFEGNLLVPNQ